MEVRIYKLKCIHCGLVKLSTTKFEICSCGEASFETLDEYPGGV
jgi:hypothetical protein